MGRRDGGSGGGSPDLGRWVLGRRTYGRRGAPSKLARDLSSPLVPQSVPLLPEQPAGQYRHRCRRVQRSSGPQVDRNRQHQREWRGCRLGLGSVGGWLAMCAVVGPESQDNGNTNVAGGGPAGWLGGGVDWPGRAGLGPQPACLTHYGRPPTASHASRSPGPAPLHTPPPLSMGRQAPSRHIRPSPRKPYPLTTPATLRPPIQAGGLTLLSRATHPF